MQKQFKEDHSQKKVIIIGAGGHGRVIADIVTLSGDVVLGFLDDKDAGEFTGITILGKLTDIDRYKEEAWMQRDGPFILHYFPFLSPS